MSNEFYWLKPRNLYGVSQAMKHADTMTEKEQLRRLFVRGIVEWSFIAAFFVALVMGFVVIDDNTTMIVANTMDAG